MNILRLERIWYTVNLDGYNFEAKIHSQGVCYDWMFVMTEDDRLGGIGGKGLKMETIGVSGQAGYAIYSELLMIVMVITWGIF